jgi:hypothetical protein
MVRPGSSTTLPGFTLLQMASGFAPSSPPNCQFYKIVPLFVYIPTITVSGVKFTGRFLLHEKGALSLKLC